MNLNLSTSSAAPKKVLRGWLSGAVVAGLAAGVCASPGQTLRQVPNEVLGVTQRSMIVGHADPSQVVHINMCLQVPDMPGLQAYADAVSDPKNPMYGKFITPAQIGARFGQSPAKVQAIVDYLKANGFTITLRDADNLHVMADGDVAQAEAAFHTTINQYHAFHGEAGRTDYYANATKLSLPISIVGAVQYVSGLENFTKPKPSVIAPNLLHVLYDIQPFYGNGFTGSGRTVAFSNWDGYRVSNLGTYYSHFGLPTPPGGVGSNVTIVKVDGGSGTGGEGGEGDLDLQMECAYSPLANIYIYDGGGGESDVLTREESDNKADTISESYGWSFNGTQATASHNIHVEMSAQGQTYMAATGDSGTDLQPFDYPDYDPEVLQVGGTVPTVNGSGVRTSEVGWSGSGGGWSTRSVSFNVLPSWQKGTGVPTTINFRLLPDVAFIADGSGGAVQVYFDGSFNGLSGTSVASPSCCGQLGTTEQYLMSLGWTGAGQNGTNRFGRIQDLLYSYNGSSTVFYDVKSGSNGNLPNGQRSQAGTGWDTVTGWGPLDFNGFVSTFSFSTVYASGYTVVDGSYRSGNVSSLSAKDSNDLTVGNVPPRTPTTPYISVSFTGTTGTKTPGTFQLNLAAFVNSTGVTQKVYLYNYSTSKYDLVDTRTASTSDNVVTLSPTGTFSNYVNQSTGAVQARVDYSVTGPTTNLNWAASFDEVLWTIK